MRSKITIDTASNFKPCIRVVEPESHWAVDEPNDVRDKLVRGFRELLHHKSNTVELIFEGDNNYILYPVEDELMYIEKLVDKWLQDAEGRDKLLLIANQIKHNIEGVPTSEDTSIEYFRNRAKEFSEKGIQKL